MRGGRRVTHRRGAGGARPGRDRQPLHPMHARCSTRSRSHSHSRNRSSLSSPADADTEAAGHSRARAGSSPDADPSRVLRTKHAAQETARQRSGLDTTTTQDVSHATPSSYPVPGWRGWGRVVAVRSAIGVLGAGSLGLVHPTRVDGVCVEVVLVGSTAECAPVLVNAGIGVAGNRVFRDVSLAPISCQRKPTVVVGCLDTYDWVLRHSDVPVLVVGGVGGLDDGLRALRAGAAGFLAAERIEGFLRCAVLAVARGTIYVDPRLVLHLLSLFDVVPAGASPRAESCLSS